MKNNMEKESPGAKSDYTIRRKVKKIFAEEVEKRSDQIKLSITYGKKFNQVIS